MVDAIAYMFCSNYLTWLAYPSHPNFLCTWFNSNILHGRHPSHLNFLIEFLTFGFNLRGHPSHPNFLF